MDSQNGTSQSSVDVQVDEDGRIIVNAPEIAAQLREANSSALARGRTVVNNQCNMVVGCGVQMQFSTPSQRTFRLPADRLVDGRFPPLGVSTVISLRQRTRT